MLYGLPPHGITGYLWDDVLVKIVFARTRWSLGESWGAVQARDVILSLAIYPVLPEDSDQLVECDPGLV